jgi:hypothetical protein
VTACPSREMGARPPGHEDFCPVPGIRQERSLYGDGPPRVNGTAARVRGKRGHRLQARSGTKPAKAPRCFYHISTKGFEQWRALATQHIGSKSIPENEPLRTAGLFSLPVTVYAAQLRRKPSAAVYEPARHHKGASLSRRWPPPLTRLPQKEAAQWRGRRKPLVESYRMTARADHACHSPTCPAKTASPSAS